jgi:hypothetical protein
MLPLAILALVIGIVVSIARVGFAFWWFTDFAEWSSRTLGLDEDAAVLVAVLMTAAVTLIGPYFAWFVLIGENRLAVTGISIAIAVAMFAVVRLVAGEVY